MLIQKRKTSRRMISLWLGLFAVVLIAGLFVYQNFFTTSAQQPTLNTNTGIKRLSVPQDLGTSIFSDPRLNQLNQSTRKTELYTNQQLVTVDTSTAIAAPTNMQAFDPGYGGTLFVSWSLSTSQITGFNLYRASTATPDFKKIASFDAKTTNYTDQDIANDQEYTYKVAAVRQQTLATVANVKRGTTSQNVTVNEITSGGNYISWQNPSTAFEAVEVSRKRGTTSTIIASLINKDTSYGDVDGQAADVYTITWYSSYKESPFSATATAQPHDITPPQSPSDVQVKNSGDGNSVQMTWVNPLDVDFDYIRIYRSTRQGVLGVLIKDAQIKNSIQQSAENGSQCSEDASLTGEGDCFVDTGLVQGQTYYYSITAVDKNKNESTARIIQPYGNQAPFGSL